MHWCLRPRQTSRRFTFHGETTLLDGYPAENELGDRRWNLSRSYQPEAGRQWPQLDLTTALRAAHRMGQSWTRVFSLIEFGLAIGLTARQQPPREYIPVTISRTATPPTPNVEGQPACREYPGSPGRWNQRVGPAGARVSDLLGPTAPVVDVGQHSWEGGPAAETFSCRQGISLQLPLTEITGRGCRDRRDGSDA